MSISIPKCPFPNPYNHNIRWLPFGMFIDLDIKGRMILNEDKSRFKIMLYQMFDGNIGYYRGQNNDYPYFMTSWQKLKTSFDKCIGWIEKEEFLDWFCTTPYFENFANKIEFAYQNNMPEGSGARFCFDFEAIAQHYEFPTNYLDITTKKEIAEFFAYTYKDKETGLYHPIEDFNKYHPHLYSSSISNELNNPYNKDLRIVGFQPLVRPILQYAMAIDYSNPKIDYNKEFQKIKLPEDKKHSFEVFERFKGGEDLLPSDDYGFQAAESVRYKIRKDKTINIDAFLKYCKEFNQNSKDIKKRLLNQGYIISDARIKTPPHIAEDMQKHIDKKLVPWVNEYITYSPQVNH